MFGRPFQLLSPLLPLILSSLAHASDRSPLIISDVDDTVKIANVPHTIPAIANGLFSKRIFPGMSVLYGIIAREPESMIFLSGGPTLLEHHVREELDEGGFPQYRLFLRNVFKKGNNASVHKRARLEELNWEMPETPFILIGDDGEKDPEILSGFATAHPGKVPAIYIHRIRARLIPPGITPFNTAFEIALNEFKAGRMTVGEAAEVGKIVLGAKGKRVFPKFVECPKTISYPTSSEIEHSVILQYLIAKNRARWSAYCASRD